LVACVPGVVGVGVALIDWLSARLALPHSRLNGGRVVKITPEGSIEWESQCWLDVEGSFDSNCRVRSWGNTHLEFSGNPSKFLQGHNLFGSNDPGGLLYGCLRVVLRHLGVAVPDGVLRLAVLGAKLSRVDLTESYGLGSRDEVRSWLRAAEDAAYLRYRGRGTLTKEGTLYFGKHSRRWSLKMYCKGDELDAHSLPVELPCRVCLGSWAHDKLRVELTLRGLELRGVGLSECGLWGDNTGQELYLSYVAGLSLSEQMRVSASVQSGLPPRLRLAYQAWWDGHDLRVQMARRTFYRYRAALLPFGVDIGVKRRRDRSRDVVQLRRVLEAVPAGIPSWAHGTSLLYVPSVLVA
jgi:II/X family phage/plasmid replication protein